MGEISTDFLLSNVWKGEIDKLSLEAVAVSWRGNLARKAEARLYVRLIVSTRQTGRHGLFCKVVRGKRLENSFSSRAKRTATAEEREEATDSSTTRKRKREENNKPDAITKKRRRNEGGVYLSLIHI